MLSNRLIKPETYIDRADAAMTAEDWQLAIKNLLKVAKKLKNNALPSVYVKLVRCYRKENMFDEARAAVKKGLAIHPDSQSLFIEDAEIAMDQKDWKMAAKLWQTVEQKFQTETPLAVHIRLGRALRLGGKLDDAQTEIDKQLSSQPENFDLIVELAEIFTAKKDWARALKNWQRALSKIDKVDQGMRQYVRLNVSVIERLANLAGYKKRTKEYQQNKKNGGARKIAIVTSVTKGYDLIMPHEYIDDRFDYFMYTDADFKNLGLYEILPLPHPELDGPRAIRYIKTHPHVLFKDYEVAVWLDTNLMIVGDIYPLIKKFQNSGQAVGSGVHPLRKNIYEEFEACVAAKKESYDVMKKQLDFYKKEGYKSKELSENTLLMFNISQPGLEPALETWWEQVNRFSRRDQLSFNYSLDKNGVSWFPITKPPHDIRNHPDFIITGHNISYPVLNELYDMLD